MIDLKLDFEFLLKKENLSDFSREIKFLQEKKETERIIQAVLLEVRRGKFVPVYEYDTMVHDR